MGTRGCFGVRIDGVDKLLYNHFDSYPTGLGRDVARFARKVPKHSRALRGAARALRVIAPDAPPPSADEQQRLAKYADTTVAEQSLASWYCLLRNTQGDLAAVLDAGVLIDARDFITDSLMCQYAYIVNFDQRRFEVYRGLQTKPHDKGRYAGSTPRSGYYACALIASYPLNKIPSRWAEAVERQVSKEYE